jgi:thioredoxin 1
MKLFKRFMVILFIAASAIVLSNVKSDCTCGSSTSFPFTFLEKIFHNNHDIPEANAFKKSGHFSLLGSVAFAQQKTANIKVTFIELGSVNCIPCKMMQPVMKQIEKKYGEQVKVVFHDVWTEQGEPFGRKYGIKAIPTQVFLDANGKEYSRHIGYFPFEEVEKVLKKSGVR